LGRHPRPWPRPGRTRGPGTSCHSPGSSGLRCRADDAHVILLRQLLDESLVCGRFHAIPILQRLAPEEEPLEPRRGYVHQEPEAPARAVALRMHAAPGDKQVGARADIPPLPVQEAARRPFEDVQRLVGAFMAVLHGDAVLSLVELEDSKPPAGLLAADRRAGAVAEPSRCPPRFLVEGHHLTPGSAPPAADGAPARAADSATSRRSASSDRVRSNRSPEAFLAGSWLLPFLWRTFPNGFFFWPGATRSPRKIAATIASASAKLRELSRAVTGGRLRRRDSPGE